MWMPRTLINRRMHQHHCTRLWGENLEEGSDIFGKSNTKGLPSHPILKTQGASNDIVVHAKALVIGVQIKALIWILFWRALKFHRFSWRDGSNLRRHFNNIEMKHKLILNFYMDCMVHVSSTMWRIKNQPSNFTSCCDIVGYRGSAPKKIKKCQSNPWIVLRTSSHVIEDFNMQHCSSCTCPPPPHT